MVEFQVYYMKNWKYGGIFSKKLSEHVRLLGTSGFNQSKAESKS